MDGTRTSEGSGPHGPTPAGPTPASPTSANPVSTQRLPLSLGDRVFDLDRPRVLDIGGGSGSTTVDLARQGAEVTVVDRSADALAMLERRAEEAGVRVRGIQGDAEDLARAVDGADFDVVLLHRLLDAVDDPAAVVAAAAAAVVPGGLISVTVPSRYSAVLDHLHHGRLTAAGEVLDGGGASTWSSQDLADLMTGAGLDLVSVIGVDPWDLVDSDAKREWPGPQALSELERRTQSDPVLRELCPLLQVVATAPAR